MTKILFKCPAMEVVPDRTDPYGKDRLTTEIKCPFTITFDDGTIPDGLVTFPVTKIRHVGFGRMLVDQCTASGVVHELGKYPARVTLNPEKCLGPYAEPVLANGAFMCSKGTGSFEGMWPGVFSIPQGGGNWKVRPVQAEFDVVLM